jgi:alpha/beta superfamily hydrolase
MSGNRLQSPKIEEALERAFKNHAAESFASDAALVAAVVVKHHGDDAARVLELAAQITRETKAAFEPVPNPVMYVEPDEDEFEDGMAALAVECAEYRS